VATIPNTFRPRDKVPNKTMLPFGAILGDSLSEPELVNTLKIPEFKSKTPML
jgi:hypothetical protein